MKTIQDIQMLGQLIRQMRKSQGLTQEQLAVASGVGIRFLRELENGKESCQIGKAFQVIQMLGLEVVIVGRGEIIS